MINIANKCDRLPVTVCNEYHQSCQRHSSSQSFPSSTLSSSSSSQTSHNHYHQFHKFAISCLVLTIFVLVALFPVVSKAYTYNGFPSFPHHLQPRRHHHNHHFHAPHQHNQFSSQIDPFSLVGASSRNYENYRKFRDHPPMSLKKFSAHKLHSTDYDIDDDDFFNENHGHKYRMMKSPPIAGTLSQNRKYLAKTPAHDKHFDKIMREQDEATIRDNEQAVLVASDRIRMRGKAMRNSLQTSDDDIYEVESAPVMNAQPYYGGGGRGGGGGGGGYGGRGGYGNDAVEEQELPIDLGIEQDDSADDPPSGSGYGQKSYYQNKHQSEEPPTDLFMTLGLSQEEESGGGGSYGQSNRGYPNKYNSRPGGQMPYSASTYSERYLFPKSSPKFSAKKFGRFDDDRLLQQNRVPPTSTMNIRDVMFDDRSSTTSMKPFLPGPSKSMDSAWLDMGAYSSGKGAFGWYSDVPVGGRM